MNRTATVSGTKTRYNRPAHMNAHACFHWLANIVLVLCAALFILFAGDYLVLHFRIAAYGVNGATARLTTFAAAPLKDGKFEVYYDQPQMETCVRSIFPWLGDEPCWYLERHPITVVY